MTDKMDDIKAFLLGCTMEERLQIRDHIRATDPQHRLEQEWNISASDILDAISSGSDLIQRGIRGVIADNAFYRYVVPTLVSSGWKAIKIVGDRPFERCSDVTAARSRSKSKCKEGRLAFQKPPSPGSIPGDKSSGLLRRRRLEGESTARGLRHVLIVLASSIFLR